MQFANKPIFYFVKLLLSDWFQCQIENAESQKNFRDPPEDMEGDILRDQVNKGNPLGWEWGPGKTLLRLGKGNRLVEGTP